MTTVYVPVQLLLLLYKKLGTAIEVRFLISDTWVITERHIWALEAEWR